MTSQGMQQGMRQGMVATAAMQLFMRALQANNMELSQMAAEAIAANPALEELPPPSPEVRPDTGEADPILLRKTHEQEQTGALNYDGTRRHDFMLASLTANTTLADYLEEQVHQSGLPIRIAEASLLLISYLDEHGYFTEPLSEIEARLHLPNSVFAKALHALQDMEPAGVGAQDLRHSLMLQLERLGESDTLSMQLLRDHWDALVRHRYAEAARELNEAEPAVIGAARRIARLNPDPGSAFSKAEEHVITPDVVVTWLGDEPQVTLTGEGLPRIGLSADYREMMAEQANNPELLKYLSRCFKEGRELIKALHDRQNTILQVAQAIVARQHPFFREGKHALAPMKMEDVAADTGLHVSTISRAVKGKYLKCHHGVYELRSFFTAALPSAEGAGVSAGAIQARIRALVDAENPAKPLSDAKIESALAAEGISVARRTIAKYREQLHILPASLRKHH